MIWVKIFPCTWFISATHECMDTSSCSAWVNWSSLISAEERASTTCFTESTTQVEPSNSSVEVISVSSLFCLDVIDGSRDELLSESLFSLIFNTFFNFSSLRSSILMLAFFMRGGRDGFNVRRELWESFLGIPPTVFPSGTLRLLLYFCEEDFPLLAEACREVSDPIRRSDSTASTSVLFVCTDTTLPCVDCLMLDPNLLSDCPKLASWSSFSQTTYKIWKTKYYSNCFNK